MGPLCRPVDRDLHHLELFDPAIKEPGVNVQPCLSLMTMAEFRKEHVFSVN